MIQNSGIAFEWRLYCLRCCSRSTGFLSLVSNEFCQFYLPTPLFWIVTDKNLFHCIWHKFFFKLFFSRCFNAVEPRLELLWNYLSCVVIWQMVKARVSNCSGGLEAYLSAYSGLDRLTEVKADARFISHLRKIARDIYDHLSEHLGQFCFKCKQLLSSVFILHLRNVRTNIQL